MAYQTVFKRYEIKYTITNKQKQLLLQAMQPYMAPDKYGRTTIRNIYFDTDNYRLVRRSLEKPDYKEKLRIRSYGQSTENSTVFVELKKKYENVVYKRRLPLGQREAMDWLCGNAPCPTDSQISREIEYFRRFYDGLRPSVFLSYEREAFFEPDGDLRVTFDDRILCRQTDLSLSSPVYGDPVIDDDTVIMEIKCSGGIPLWLVEVLSKEKIYKTSFSKYGKAYEALILPNLPFKKTYSKKEILHHEYIL